MLVFAVFVAIGVTGEVLLPSSGFARFTAIGVDGEAVLGFVTFHAELPAPDYPRCRKRVAETGRGGSATTNGTRTAGADENRGAVGAPTYCRTGSAGSDRCVASACECRQAHRYHQMPERRRSGCTHASAFRGINRRRVEAHRLRPQLGRTSARDNGGGQSQSPPSIQAATALISALTIAGLSAGGPDFSLPRQHIAIPPPGTRPADAAVRLTIGRK